ncbi:MAG: hypothetical protein N3A62_00725 [Thermodesulfovibrionales bacterium]|nr:hypothetical protein [Thermodesulfovibrionales bacterium]
MRRLIWIPLMSFCVFVLGCSSYYASSMNSSGYSIYDTSYYQNYAYCDEQWHASRCADKKYSYTKIKQIDFPVDYRLKYRECSVPISQTATGQTGYQ